MLWPDLAEVSRKGMFQFCANSSPLCFGTSLPSSKSHLLPISSCSTSGAAFWVGGQTKERSHATKLIISHSQKNISELLDAKGQHTCTYQWKCLVIMLIIGYQYKLPQDWHHHSNVTSKQSHTLTSTICCRYFVMLSNELTFVMSYTIITPCSGRGVYLQDGSRMVNYTQILKTWMICQRLWEYRPHFILKEVMPK